MKKSIGLVLGMFCLCFVMNGMKVNAATSRETHVCAYSYMGIQTIENRFLTSHTYLAYNGNSSYYAKCEVYHKHTVKVYKCACGNSYNQDAFNGNVHTACGQ